jgi:hypothetical protein
MESFFASLKRSIFIGGSMLQYKTQRGILQDEEDGPKSWIVSKYVYGIKAHYKIDYQSTAKEE